MTRHLARKAALQILYQLDTNPTLTVLQGIHEYETHFSAAGPAPLKGDAFIARLVEGVRGHLSEIDASIVQVAQNWTIKRMPAVDRNLIRLGAFEILFCDDIPATVTIDQMVEIAKGYGSEESGRFINGVLDKLRVEFPRPGKKA